MLPTQQDSAKHPILCDSFVNVILFHDFCQTRDAQQEHPQESDDSAIQFKCLSERLNMTPYGYGLEHELNEETRRMQNEWFFKWHFIGQNQPVEIDSFDGRMISYGGIKFFGTAQAVYWDTLERYAAKKVHEIFEDTGKAISNYPADSARQAIDDAEQLVTNFLEKLTRIAIEKDSILRGNGFERAKPTGTQGRDLLKSQPIKQRAAALRALLNATKETDVSKTQETIDTRKEKDLPPTNPSYSEFKNELLIAIAISGKAVSTAMLAPAEVAKQHNLIYREGWVRQAVKSLDENGFISARFALGGGPDGGMHVSITGDGLEHAEQLCNGVASDLYERIDEFWSGAASEKNVEETESVPASDRIVKINHNSEEYKEIENKLAKVVLTARTSNSLSNDDTDLRDQKIAELEAGKRLLDAPQADANLVRRTLVPALKWLADKIVDNAVSVLITSLIALIGAYFGFA